MDRALRSSRADGCGRGLPPFPPARWLRKQDAPFADVRRAEIDAYLRELLSARPLQAHAAVRQALGLD
eukprot:6054303-Prymnesium_polylepis.1